jgi:hypothetical protein
MTIVRSKPIVGLDLAVAKSFEKAIERHNVKNSGGNSAIL